MRVAINNFTGGEIASTLSARYDLARYRNALACMENFFPNLHGAATRRPGTMFMADLGEACVLLPFSFSSDAADNFVLIFGDNTLRVANNSGALLAGDVLETPYAAAEVPDISYAQVGDVIYLAHKAHPLHKVTRSGVGPDHAWLLAPVALNTSLPAPGTPVIKFAGGGTGFTMRYKVVAVDDKGKESLPSPAGAVDGRHPSDWVQGNSATVSWQAVAGAVEYNIYREEAGYFGFIGVADASTATGGTVSGLYVGSIVTPVVKFSGAISRNIVVANGAPGVANGDSTSALAVSANAGQNAFAFDGKLLVWTTKTTSTTTWENNGDYWTSSTSTSYERFWALLNTSSPVGTYATYKTGQLGNDSVCPKGIVDVYTVTPVYSGGTSISFIDNNYQADIADTPREDWDPFADGNNPGVVAFHQQRMVLAGTKNAPQAFYMSRVGDFENFRKSRPLQEDDPVEYHIASGAIDSVTWAASFGDLLIGTSGSEYKAGGDGQAITVSNISITAQSYWGSARLKPIIIGNSVMHVQRHGARVRDLFYSLEKDGYAGNDLSILSPHLFDGHSLVQWDYQQTPGSHIWIVRDDGTLLCLTYMKEHDIWGWSRHMTDGEVTSVAAISGDNEDVIMLVVRRTVAGKTRYYLERLAPQWRGGLGVEQAFFVDCGITQESAEATVVVEGLAHLEGCSVVALADGSPVEGLIVQNGAVTLPYPATVAHVGLAYVSRLSPMPVEGDVQGSGATLGRNRACGQCSVRLSESVGGKYGAAPDMLFDFPFLPAQWGAPVELFSGDMDFIPGGGMNTQESLWLVQDRPLPFTVSALSLHIDMAQN